MQLVAGLRILVVADLGLVGERELGALLLADEDTFGDRRGTVALGELVRVRHRFDGELHLFRADEVEVLDVVGVHGVGFRALRRHRHGRQTVPGHTVLVVLGRLVVLVQDAGLVPDKCRHGHSLTS